MFRFHRLIISLKQNSSVKYTSGIMNSFTVWIVRHGETPYNKKNIIQGQLDIPLSDVGLEQARSVGICLSEQNFSHVYSSDLLRASQTAEEIIGRNNNFSGTIIHDARLREIKSGVCEGKPLVNLKQEAAKAGKSLADYTPPGGETLKQLHDRAVSFFADLCEKMRSRNDSNCNFGMNFSSVKGEGKGAGHSVHQSTQNSVAVHACDNTRMDSIDEEKESCSTHVNCSDKSSTENLPEGILSSSAGRDGKPLSNVLLVSHGGFIKELLRHFSDLHCQYNGKKVRAFRLPPNASISKFLVSLDKPPQISCILLHSCQHLQNPSPELRSDDDTAL